MKSCSTISTIHWRPKTLDIDYFYSLAELLCYYFMFSCLQVAAGIPGLPTFFPSTGWVCRCVTKLFGCKRSVQNYVIHYLWHMTAKNLCKWVSARKCVLHHDSLRRGALHHSTIPWPHYGVTASPFLCHTQGKAQPATCQLHSSSAVLGHHRHRSSYNRHTPAISSVGTATARYRSGVGIQRRRPMFKAWQIQDMWITVVVDVPFGYVASE